MRSRRHGEDCSQQHSQCRGEQLDARHVAQRVVGPHAPRAYCCHTTEARVHADLGESSFRSLMIVQTFHEPCAVPVEHLGALTLEPPTPKPIGQPKGGTCRANERGGRSGGRAPWRHHRPDRHSLPRIRCPACGTRSVQTFPQLVEPETMPLPTAMAVWRCQSRTTGSMHLRECPGSPTRHSREKLDRRTAPAATARASPVLVQTSWIASRSCA